MADVAKTSSLKSVQPWPNLTLGQVLGFGQLSTSIYIFIIHDIHMYVCMYEMYECMSRPRLYFFIIANECMWPRVYPDHHVSSMNDT